MGHPVELTTLDSEKKTIHFEQTKHSHSEIDIWDPSWCKTNNPSSCCLHSYETSHSGGLLSPLTPVLWENQRCPQTPAKPQKVSNSNTLSQSYFHENDEPLSLSQNQNLTDFQPSGSKHAVIFVLIPGKGPGSLVIFPPKSFTASAVLYTSSVPIAIWQ